MSEIIDVSLAVSRNVWRAMPRSSDVSPFPPFLHVLHNLPREIWLCPLCHFSWLPWLLWNFPAISLPNHGYPSLEKAVCLLVKQMIEMRNQTPQIQVCICFSNFCDLFICLMYLYVFPGKCKGFLYEPQLVSQKIALKWAWSIGDWKYLVLITVHSYCKMVWQVADCMWQTKVKLKKRQYKTEDRTAC